MALTLIFRIPYNSWGSVYHYYGLKVIITDILLCQNLFAINRSVIGPMWSLPYEVQMYLLLPALFTIVRRRKSSIALVGIWIAAIVIGFVQPWAARTDMGRLLCIDRLSIAEYIPCFLAGVTANYITLHWNGPRLRFWLWPLLLVVITAVYLRWHAGGEAYVEWSSCFVIGFVVTCCRESSLEGLNRLTHYVAKYSYGLYLGQVPALCWHS